MSFRRRSAPLGVLFLTCALAAAAIVVLAARTPSISYAQADDSTAALGRPTDYVLDGAGVLGEKGRVELARYLGKIERELGVQCAVVTVPTTGRTSIEEFATKLYERWGIGGEKKDEGLLVVVAMDQRLVRFEVGYGLEPVITDARAGSIIRNTIRPGFRRGDFAGGLIDGMVDAATYIAQDRRVPVPKPDGRAVRSKSRKIPPFAIILLIFAFIVFVNIMAAQQRRGYRGRRRGSFWGGPGPWIGGGGFGGGNWGGGSSGGFGGGSSGSGFGGFGGGASGGGGATGGW